MMMQVRFFLALMVCVEGLLWAKVDISLHTVKNPLAYDYVEYPRYQSRIFQDIKALGAEAVETVFDLYKNLISWESYALLVASFPVFITSRMYDHKLQSCFYERKYHKNIDQMPNFYFNMVEGGIGIPIMLLGSYALYGKTKETRKVGRTFLTAMPFVIFGKDVIKMLRFDFCKRPWNQHFRCDRQAHGGFPSGHMAQAVYMASFFGMRYGPSHAVPLGMYAILVGATFINCNRHYLSQIVAGAVWGAMFAVSSNKIIEKYERSQHKISFDMTMNDQGVPSVSLSYNF